MDEDELKKHALNRHILSNPRKQRVLWARVSALKRVLVRNGLITHEEYEDYVEAMVRSINKSVESGLRRDLGLEEEDGPPVPSVALDANTGSAPIPGADATDPEAEVEE